jgi:hypothetical protein
MLGLTIQLSIFTDLYIPIASTSCYLKKVCRNLGPARPRSVVSAGKLPATLAEVTLDPRPHMCERHDHSNIPAAQFTCHIPSRAMKRR